MKASRFLLILSISFTLSSTSIADELGPMRIISTAPAITEMVWAAGATDRLVAVSDYCRFPPEVKNLPKIGGLMNLNYELIRRLKPDMVLLMYPSGDIGNRLKEMGISYGVFANETFGEIRESIRVMCGLFGHEQQCKPFLENWDRELNAIQDKYLKAKRCPKTMVVVGREAGKIAGLYVAGRNSFYDEILGILQCDNAFAESHQKYFQPSLEAIARAKPEIIIEIWAGEKFTDDKKKKLVDDWKTMKVLPAVRDRKIYILTEDFVGIPSARAIEVLKLFESVVRGANCM